MILDGQHKEEERRRHTGRGQGEARQAFPGASRLGCAHCLGFCLEWDGAVVSCSCPLDRVWDAQDLVQHLF